MYELWTIWPANLYLEFKTAAEAKQAIDDIVNHEGVEGLNNLVLFSGVSADDPGEFVAQDASIAEAATRLDAIERLLKMLAPSGATLAQDSELIEHFLQSIDSALLATTNKDWLQGFLAAALHDVSIDMDSGVVRIGKSLEFPVSDLKSLKPTG